MLIVSVLLFSQLKHVSFDICSIQKQKLQNGLFEMVSYNPLLIRSAATRANCKKQQKRI